MRVLVTGADGFVGQHLLACLVEQGFETAGTYLGESPQPGTLPAQISESVSWYHMDLLDSPSVAATTEAFRPEGVVHLAGLSSGLHASRDPRKAYEVNVIGTQILLSALAKGSSTAQAGRVVIAGSGDTYGAAAQDRLPLTEDAPLKPLNPYSASKAAQEMVAMEYGLSHRLPVVIARAFNHTGPGQRPPFVAPDWALQLLQAEAQGRQAMKVGNLEVHRDFCDVRDVVRAYALLLRGGESGEVFNVCSGQASALETILALLQEATGVVLPLERDPSRSRKAEVPEIRGSYRKIEAVLGWTPSTPIRQTIFDLVSELRETIGEK